MRVFGARFCALIAVAAVCAGSWSCAGGGGQRGWTPPPDYAGDNPAERLRRARAISQQAQRADRAGDREGAIEHYRRAIAEYPEFGAAWNNLGVLLMEDDPLEAVSAFATASELSPRDPRPVYNLGVIWERSGYADEASRHYRRALARDANYLPALRGSIHMDHLRNASDEDTALALRRAMMLETDPRWREYFERQLILVRNKLNDR